MAKYIVDLDSFLECLDFLSEGKINGLSYTYLQNVKAFTQRFPKEEYKENAVAYREYTNDVDKDILEGRGLKPLESCEHEWECCGISTGGTDYVCKKCGTYKVRPHDYNDKISVTIQN